jgi:hypothetical protein
MKKEVDNYIARFLKVRTEHINPVGLLQPFPIPKWKWGVATIDFITKLPRTMEKHDSIMVVVDKFSKATHFILVSITHKSTNIAYIT